MPKICRMVELFLLNYFGYLKYNVYINVAFTNKKQSFQVINKVV